MESNPSWTAWHTDLTAGKGLQLDNSGGEISPSGGHIGAVSSTTITLTKGSSNNNAVNLAEEYVFYAFAPIEGYSSFGSYTGNNDTDGPFIYTGFKPAFVMMKRIDSTGNWVIFDDKRSPINPRALQLHPNLTNVDGAGNDQNFLANGWKVRATGSDVNASSGDYIYAAFAENPFGGSGVAQAKAV